MPDGLYERDVLVWAEQQAALLRRLSAGERLNESIDWLHVIQEVQDVGLSELRACRSLIPQALVHLLKLHAWPASRAAGHWRSEVLGFLGDARDSFTPSMEQRIDLDQLYARALAQVAEIVDDSGRPCALPEVCPFNTGQLLAKQPSVSALMAALDGPGVGGPA